MSAPGVAGHHAAEPIATAPAPGADRWRVWARRVVVVALVSLQLGLVVRAYSTPHREFGFQMFPESSQWRADVVRVTTDGDRVSIEQPWAGYTWNELVRGRGLGSPWRRHHADAGIENQLAFLAEAMAWVSGNTPDDAETRYLEAEVTTWHNLGEPETLVMRGPSRPVAP